MNILGISAFYHDSAAAIIRDGIIVAAAQEERFTRIKHDYSFPENAIEYCLRAANLNLKNIDYIVFYEKPFLKFERLLETYLAFAPSGFLSFLKALPIWIKEKLFQKRELMASLNAIEKVENLKDKILFAEHHQSHAASAFYPSPFNEALVLTLDGVGEWTTTSVCVGKDNSLTMHKEIHFPHSLGLLYSAFTYYTGFKVNSGEYKIMGLAPYGRPKYADLIYKHLVDIRPDGTFRLNMEYFNYCVGLTMTNQKFHDLFGGPPRKPESEITQKEMDLAASIQVVLEDILLKILKSLRQEYNIPNLCLAGGVALNCVANGKILKEKIFDNIWIQPAAGDAGGALGAALAAYHDHLHFPRVQIPKQLDAMQGAYLGPIYVQDDIEIRLERARATYTVFSKMELISKTAALLAQNKVVGWFQGRMEFGPRALGNRSILANPMSTDMQKVLNLKIKFRESFRPFAPAVLAEDLQDWFELDVPSPYMLLVSDVGKNRRLPVSENFDKLFGIDKLNVNRSTVPAVTHVDFSARIQTVHQETNQDFYQLISEFKHLTACPVLINTSFNIRGEPIVCTPEDAFRCFMGTEMDALVIGNCMLLKEEQDITLKKQYINQFELD